MVSALIFGARVKKLNNNPLSPLWYNTSQKNNSCAKARKTTSLQKQISNEKFRGCSQTQKPFSFTLITFFPAVAFNFYVWSLSLIVSGSCRQFDYSSSSLLDSFLIPTVSRLKLVSALDDAFSFSSSLHFLSSVLGGVAVNTLLLCENRISKKESSWTSCNICWVHHIKRKRYVEYSIFFLNYENVCIRINDHAQTCNSLLDTSQTGNTIDVCILLFIVYTSKPSNLYTEFIASISCWI